MQVMSVFNSSPMKFGWSLPSLSGLPLEQLGGFVARNAAEYPILVDTGNMLAQQIPSTAYEGGKGAWNQRQQRKDFQPEPTQAGQTQSAQTRISDQVQTRFGGQLAGDSQKSHPKIQNSGRLCGLERDAFTPAVSSERDANGQAFHDAKTEKARLEHGSDFNSPSPEALSHDLTLAGQYDGQMSPFAGQPSEGNSESLGGQVSNAFNRARQITPPINPLTSLPSYNI